MKIKAIISLLSALVVSLFIGCGGSSGGGDNVSFMGTFSSTESSARRLRGLENVIVCTLGNCSETDASGTWVFDVPVNVYPGGEVLFSFEQAGIVTNKVVRDLSPEAREVVIDFVIDLDGDIQIESLVQDGVPTSIDNDNDNNNMDNNDDDRSPESFRACNLFEQSNLLITDSVSTVTHSTSTDPCPQSISQIISVANAGDFPVEYEITVDLSDISIFPTTGTISPGEIITHEGALSCDSGDSFNTVINARVTRFVPNDGGVPLTDNEAAEICGQTDFSLGNVIDSVEINVEMLP